MYVLLAVAGTLMSVQLTVADFASEMVYAHNKVRRNHEDTPDVEWDPTVAAAAQEWADKLVAENKFYHGASGENLGMSIPENGAAANAAFQWYEEYNYYDYDDPKFSMDTGHFTQVVWKASTKIGCGIGKCTDLYPFTVYIVVCRYDPVGNFNNLFGENVGKIKNTNDVPGSAADLRP